MDGGYINEGGQLKSKNGQKYIINHPNDGFFITKTHAVLIGVLTVIVMAAIILLTYFLLAHSCTADSNARPYESQDQIKAAGFIGAAKKATTPKTLTKADNSSHITTSMADKSLTTIKSNNETNLTTLKPLVSIDNESSRVITLNEGWSPTLYRLIIQPHIVNGTSNGHVVIDIVKDANITDWPPIVLDINNITITRAQVTLHKNSSKIGSPLDIKTSYGDNNDTFIIKLDKIDSVKNASMFQVDLKFVSQLTDTLQGCYRVSYEDSDSDTKKSLVSTQFSPIDARRAFPCFDRPDKKAQFKISLIHEEKKTMALSNMPSEFLSYSHPGYLREDFQITPKMSTYLVAFMVSDLVNTNVTDGIEKQSNLPNINIWTRKNVADMTRYAYDLTSKILPFFERYFGINFKLPKIDMVAVPDFGFSAMENWGLITFRESALLVPEDEARRSSAEHTEFVASIIAHELAHQWFGNLVTMKWWDDLWLKEGFATFMSYVALEEIKPKWKYFDFFSINELQKSMEKDSDQNSHSISFAVSKPVDIWRIFDPISYSKGASILRMMQSYLGESAFKDAITEYLNKFKYSNAVQDDLWALMTKYGHQYNTLPSELNVKQIMDSWTLQPGYPIVSVERYGTSVHISQQRYLLPKVNQSDESKWFIPITYETQANRTQVGVPQYWLSKSKNITLSNVVDPEHWIYFNIKRAGYYRVNYDYSSWIILIRTYEELPEVIRAQLIDDALNLARAEVVSYDIPLTFFLKLRGIDILPWAAATPGIRYLTNMLNREPAYEHYRALMRYIIKPIYTEMGFDEKANETHVQLMHRQRIVRHACFFSHDWCTNRAQMLYREWMRDKTQNLISPNLKGTIYCTALREGSFQEWYFAYNRYLETTSASEKELILNALGCTTKPWLLAKYLNMTISPTSGIRKQDGARAFMAVAKNSVGSDIAFDFLVSNIKEISEYFGDGFSTLSKMIDSVTIFMNKDYHMEQFERFVKRAQELGLKSVERSTLLAQETVKNNIFWRSRSYYKLQGFLEKLTTDLHINLY